MPNLPVNCIVYQSYAKDDLYIGTDIGVFHKDSTMSEWQLFNNGLPHVSVRELEIQYNIGKIRGAFLEGESGKVTLIYSRTQ